MQQKAKHNRQANDFRKELRGYLSLNASEIKSIQVSVAKENLQELKTHLMRVSKFEKLIKFFTIMSKCGETIMAALEKSRKKKLIENKASFVQ